MKKINLVYASLLSAAMVGAGTSCSDFLEVEPQNIITLEQFWNEESDVTNSIAGCYSAMQSYDFISRMMVWGEFRSENIINRGIIKDDVSLERVLKENITASNAYTTWNSFYNIINRCNIIMHYAPSVQANDPSYSKSQLQAHIAEVTAIRSLCYFYLIRTFRDVPYTREVFLDDAQNMRLPQSSFEYILDELITDLEAVKDDAVIYYPKVEGLGKYYQTGRVTQLSIYTMLCDLYLWRASLKDNPNSVADYNQCIKYADFVIAFKKKQVDEDNKVKVDYSDFYNYPLTATKTVGMTDSYGSAFNDIFVSGNSNESIFELTFVKNNDNMLSNGPFCFFYGGDGRTGFVKPSDYVATDVKNAKPVIFNNKYDGRAYENMRFNTSGEAEAVNKYVVQSSITLGNPTLTSFYSEGFWGTYYPTFGAKQDSRNKSNFIFYRLTDVMLMKAEALTQLMADGSEGLDEENTKLRDEAFMLCNIVNKRSLYQNEYKDTLVLTNYPTKELITNLVYDERNRELMFEGKRYFDLVRHSMRDGNTDYLRSHVKQKSTDNASVIENQLSRMEAIFWPVNLEELKVNDQLKQNPAFGSGENGSFEKN